MNLSALASANDAPANDAPANDAERNLALLPVLLFIALMAVVGTAGNAIVCYVYGYRLKLTVTKQFIFILAILDLVNCVICAPTEMVMTFKIVSFDSPILCKASRFLTYGLNGSTSLVLLALAVDRYCKVCRPLEVCFTKDRARTVCILAIVVSFAMSWPSWVIYGTKNIHTGVNGTTCLIQDAYESTWYPLIFYSIFFLLFLSIAVAIIFLYALIARQIRELRRRQDERISRSPVNRVSGTGATPVECTGVLLENKTGSDDLLKPASARTANHAGKIAQALLKEIHKRKTAYKPGRSTFMLFLITIVFMLSFVPFFITAIIRGSKRSKFIPSLNYKEVIVTQFFLRSYLLSNAANPIIYNLFNSEFRRECKRLFCRCCRTRNLSVEIRIEQASDNTQSLL